VVLKDRPTLEGVNVTLVTTNPKKMTEIKMTSSLGKVTTRKLNSADGFHTRIGTKSMSAAGRETRKVSMTLTMAIGQYATRRSLNLEVLKGRRKFLLKPFKP